MTLRARLGDGLDGVREYMTLLSATPASSRTLSRAVALRDRELWDALDGAPARVLDRDGLVRYFPTERFRATTR